MKTIHTIIGVFLMSFSVFNHAESNTDLSKMMINANSALVELMPYIYNDMKFRDKENEPVIEAQLTALIGSIDSTPSLLSEHATTLKISQRVLLENLRQAEDLYKHANYSTAQYLLSSVPVICSSCHIQDGAHSKIGHKVDPSWFANDFSFAEFNYYTRNYNEAKQAYIRHLDQPQILASRIQATKTLERLLELMLISEKSPQNSKALLMSIQARDGLHSETKQVIGQWIDGVDSLTTTPDTLDNLEAFTFKQFDEQFTLRHEFVFDEVNRPVALTWRLALHKLAAKPQTAVDKARILLLLSVLDRILGDQEEISLSNLYLKECIHLQVPKYSDKCINEYENHLYFYYGGSSGEHLPKDVYDELKILKLKNEG